MVESAGICVGADVQADGGDVAFRFAAAGFLALEPFPAWKLRAFHHQFNHRKSALFRSYAGGQHVTYFVQTSGRGFGRRRDCLFRPGWQTLCGPTSVTSPKPFGRRISQFLPASVSLAGRFDDGRGILAGTVVGIVYLARPANPYLPVGWFWFLGTLVPTIGLVQVGSQSMAGPLHVYPSVGLFILVVWGLDDFLNWRPHWRRIAALAGAWHWRVVWSSPAFNFSYWQNSIRLFRHAIEATTDNFVAYTCLGETSETWA